MGQWTNRLYEYFRQPESQTFSTKRLSVSLRKQRQLLKAQVVIIIITDTQRRLCPVMQLFTLARVSSSQDDLFSSAKSNETVASNEDDAVELMMYRQCSSGSGVVSPNTPQSQVPPEPLPDELDPAERGEAPPLREVRTMSKVSRGCFFTVKQRFQLVVSFVLQASAKFGDNHRFCNIKVRKSFAQTLFGLHVL